MCARQQEQLIWNWKPTEQFVDTNAHITLIMGNMFMWDQHLVHLAMCVLCVTNRLLCTGNQKSNLLTSILISLLSWAISYRFETEQFEDTNKHLNWWHCSSLETFGVAATLCLCGTNNWYIWKYIWQCLYYVGSTFNTFGNVCIMCDQHAIMCRKSVRASS